jgi:hypothetical protein
MEPVRQLLGSRDIHGTGVAELKPADHVYATRFGLAQHRHPQPGAVSGPGRVGVHHQAAGLAGVIGDRRVQRLARRVQGAGRRPLVPLQQPLQEPEHPVGRDPLGSWGLVQAELPAPLHMRSAGEPPVGHGHAGQAKREVGGDLDGDPLPGPEP